jgi:hypothetical protein
MIKSIKRIYENITMNPPHCIINMHYKTWKACLMITVSCGSIFFTQVGFKCVLLCFFEVESCFTAQAGLQPRIFLPQITRVYLVFPNLKLF